MEGQDLSLTAGRAPRACQSCKSRKRKCDKALPGCTLCRSKRWKCVYESPSLPSPESDSYIGKNPTPDYVHQVTEQPEFPPVYFLDANIFHRCRLETPKIDLPIPQHIREQNGDFHKIRLTSSEYFDHLHHTIPFISKTRFYEHHLNPLSPPRAEIALLILSMRVANTPPDAHTPPAKALGYLHAKQFLIDLLNAGTFNLQLLQAGILIALYELGHAIYPAAYITTGICARYGCALGLTGQGDSDLRSSADWNELEERKRAWWAVLILDRYVTLGNPSRPLASVEPEGSSILPIDDDAWNKGILPSTPSFTLSSPSSVHMGRFARFAQACHLMGLTLRHVADQASEAEASSSSKQFREEEAAQIRRTLIALVNLSKEEAKMRSLEFCTSVSCCYSALLLLENSQTISKRDPWTTIEDMRIPLSISEDAKVVCRNYLDSIFPPLDLISPFILHYIYHTCAIYLESYRTTQDPEFAAGLATLRETLEVLNRRWKSAGAYLELLKAREFIHAW